MTNEQINALIGYIHAVASYYAHRATTAESVSRAAGMNRAEDFLRSQFDADYYSNLSNRSERE